MRRYLSPRDRRSHALMLTAKGTRLMAELYALAERHELKIVGAIGIETHPAGGYPLEAIV